MTLRGAVDENRQAGPIDGRFLVFVAGLALELLLIGLMLRQLLALSPRRNLAEMVVPRRTFDDVILPARTREALADALVQIEKRDLIFEDWGLGERHETGLGLAFHFAGPPGTGKTICAEAVAKTLGRPLLKVRYSEIESAWAGETGKNVVAVFREARASNAVLFFDEADSIASRRFSGTSHGFEREANQTVNILLEELEACQGVVIFATNLASNFDPAFERRIRSHVLFELPNELEREKIWLAQLHPRKTPIGSDVDFSELARMYPASGGDIRNAVLNAAQRAAAEPGDDGRKAIRRQHFISGMERVVEGKRVMEQSLFRPAPSVMAQLPGAIPRSLSASRWALLAAVLLLLAAGGFLGWASAVLWFR